MATKKAAAKAEVEKDVAGLKTWLSSVATPLVKFFEGRVLWLLALPAGVWAYLDRALLKTWLSLILGAVIIVGVALLIRKITMPAVDIQKAAEKAQEDPIGAALIFLGGVLFMVAVIIAVGSFVGGMKG